MTNDCHNWLWPLSCMTSEYERLLHTVKTGSDFVGIITTCTANFALKTGNNLFSIMSVLIVTLFVLKFFSDHYISVQLGIINQIKVQVPL